MIGRRVSRRAVAAEEARMTRYGGGEGAETYARARRRGKRRAGRGGKGPGGYKKKVGGCPGVRLFRVNAPGNTGTRDPRVL